MAIKTRSIKKEEIIKKWLLIDATDVRLGQLATKCASLLMGKHKVTKVDYLDSGDNVVVINAGKIELHRRKETKKVYYTHSNFPDGLKVKPYLEVRANNPAYIIKQAVWGMLPKNRMGKKILENLYVFPGVEHDKQAQQPTKVII